eukprot:2213423-Amphidinium_carterae.1
MRFAIKVAQAKLQRMRLSLTVVCHSDEHPDNLGRVHAGLLMVLGVQNDKLLQTLARWYTRPITTN